MQGKVKDEKRRRKKIWAVRRKKNEMPPTRVQNQVASLWFL
jgi:hypothetical protein